MKLTIAQSIHASAGPIGHCLKCPKMAIEVGEAGAAMRCTLDGELLQKHVAELNCGLGLFKAGIGDLVKRFLVRGGIDYFCTPCEMRRRMLNSRWGGCFHWLDDATWRRLTYCPPCEEEGKTSDHRFLRWMLAWAIIANSLAWAVQNYAPEKYHYGVPAWIKDWINDGL